MSFDLTLNLRFNSIMYKTSHDYKPKFLTLSALFLVLGLTACASTPEPIEQISEPVQYEDTVVEIFEPAPNVVPARETVPSIDIEEYERRLAEDAAAIRAAEEALKPKVIPKPVVKKTLDQRLASARNANGKLAILKNEPPSDEINAMLLAAYTEKLTEDRTAGDNAGSAEALVYLGQHDAKDGSRDNNMLALRKYAEALKLDPQNTEAPRLVSQVRGSLQSYSDTLHKEAVSYFVKQDFESAAERWEKVILIDPGNNAARNWYNQATQSLTR